MPPPFVRPSTPNPAAFVPVVKAATQKIPVAKAPQSPPTPCTATTSSESSRDVRVRHCTARKQRMPATAPMPIASIGCTYPDAGVIATRPATAPAAAPTTLGFPLIHQLMPTQASAAAAAAVLVTVKALTATALAAPALPALKPNHPNHRIEAPSTIIVTSCGSIGSSLKPLRRPNMIAAASAAAPAFR